MITAALHLTAAALLASLLGETSPLTLVLALVLALAPDVDTPKSLVGSMLKPISVPLERRAGHRTATHSALALGGVAGVAYLLAPTHWLVLAGAYGSHLALDLLIGVQGITLLWPSGEFLTLTGWRDDGPAPRILLGLLLPAAVVAALWPQLGPVLSAPVHAAVAAANPIATPSPMPTARPSIHLSFELPAGVGLSALQVHAGDTIAEGQILARWERPSCTAAPPCAAWPAPTPPLLPSPPAAPPAPFVDGSADRALVEAKAALAALTTAQAAERAALVAEHDRQLAEGRRKLADARRALDQLQPQHEREQAERLHAVDVARQALVDARAAETLAGQGDPAAAQREAECVHAAEARLRAALDDQDRMRTEQGIARAEAEAVVASAQGDLDALPERQRQALARLDAEHGAARSLAEARVTSARGQVADAQRATERDATLTAATATAAAVTWQLQASATAQAYYADVTATARALPTPAPTSVIGRAAGRVVSVSAEEKEGRLVVTLELTSAQ